MTTYGERLRAARWARGLTLRDVAKQTGCSFSYLSDLERGRHVPEGMTAAQARIGAFLGVYPDSVPMQAPAPRTVMARIGRSWCAVCGRREG